MREVRLQIALFLASNPPRTSRASCITSMSAPNAGARRALSLRQIRDKEHPLCYGLCSLRMPHQKRAPGPLIYREPISTVHGNAEVIAVLGLELGLVVGIAEPVVHPSASGSDLPATWPSPLRNVTITRAPTGTVRFHEPCCVEKIAPWYFFGNMQPV
jgi:hypothetical protein